MIKTYVGLALAVLFAGFSATTLADTSKLKTTDRAAAKALRGYDTVVIADFADGVTKTLPDAGENERYHAEVADAGKRFADNLAAKLTASKGYTTVSRTTGAGKALLVTGQFTEFTASNLVGRYIGLGVGGSAFVAKVTLKDAESGAELGVIDVDLSSSPIPGASNVVQTVERFLDGAAVRTRDELLIAKGFVAREQTGRSGRLRAQYGLDQEKKK